MDPVPDGQKTCSCYTFENGRLTRQQAKESCKHISKAHVVLETEEKWEFIEKRVKYRTDVPHHEWHIGLYKNRTSGSWTWINGKILTLKKWQKDNPVKNQYDAVIAINRPSGSNGSFKSIKGSVQIEWIYEEERGINTAVQCPALALTTGREIVPLPLTP